MDEVIRPTAATLAHATVYISAAIRSTDVCATDVAARRGIRIREGIKNTPYNTECVCFFNDTHQYQNHEETNDEGSFPKHFPNHPGACVVLEPKELLS